MNVQVLGISVDHIPCLKAWTASLGGITYPVLSDFWPHGALSQKYGVLREEGFSERAIFILDREGIIRYIDIHDIDQMPSTEDLLNEVAKYSDRPAPAKPAADEIPGLPRGGVVLYCTSWCPDCRRARAWLNQNEIPFTEVDIERVPGASAQVKKWTGGTLTTPTFDIDGKIIIDYKLDQVRELLRAKGYNLI